MKIHPFLYWNRTLFFFMLQGMNRDSLPLCIRMFYALQQRPFWPWIQLKYPLEFLLKKMYTMLKVTVFWDVILNPSTDSYHSSGRESSAATFIVEKKF
jgi:hypothetical protein